jgi:hypothetical protein
MRAIRQSGSEGGGVQILSLPNQRIMTPFGRAPPGSSAPDDINRPSTHPDRNGPKFYAVRALDAGKAEAAAAKR